MASELAVSASVYHRDENGVLHPYDRTLTKVILAAAVQGVSRVKASGTRGAPAFDLGRMKQLKSRSLKEEDIVIEIPWNARSLRAAVSLHGEASLRRKVLEMALSRIRQEQSLSKILDIKAVPARSISENPNLGPGHLPYDNFVASLITATPASKPHESPSSGEKLFDAILETAMDPTESNVRLLESQGLWIVFHGTKHAGMDGILSTGLLPEFRRSSRDRDWFGVSYGTSLKYTLTKTGLSSGRHKGYPQDTGTGTANCNRVAGASEPVLRSTGAPESGCAYVSYYLYAPTGSKLMGQTMGLLCSFYVGIRLHRLFERRDERWNITRKVVYCSA